MPNTDPRVDTYIAKAAPFAQPILTRLRASVHAACPGCEETVKWRMPFFLSDGRIVCYMAAFKAHAAFGLWRGGKAALPAGSTRAGEAMGQLGRITSLADLPSDAKLRGWIRKATRLRTSATPSSKSKTARPGTRKYARTARRKT